MAQSQTEGTESLNDIEASAVEQVSEDVEQKVRGNEPVLCPPYCYAAVVAGGFAKGYVATRSAGDSAQTTGDSPETEPGERLENADVDELLEARSDLS